MNCHKSNTQGRLSTPISIIPQNQDDRELFNAISSFFCTFGVGKLLRKCNAQKEKGIPVLDIFKYKLCNVFSDRSMYMQLKTNSFREAFSKNTFYRFLNSTKTNWMRFTTLLSKTISDTIEPLTGEDRINDFVIDDGMFERTSCKKTELGSGVFELFSEYHSLSYDAITAHFAIVFTRYMMIAVEQRRNENKHTLILCYYGCVLNLKVILRATE